MLDLKNSYRWVKDDEKGEQSSNTKKKVEEDEIPF